MKKTIIILLVVIVLVGGVYYFVSSKKVEETTIPVDQANAKINIDAVCEGALAYMTFPDGASADRFVQDCKEGKHPEVIEKYKADMGLGDGAKI